MKKKVLVLMADTGFGHRSAAKAIVKALESRYGDRLEAVMVNVLDDSRAPAFLREGQADYDSVARDWPQLNELSFRMSDMVLTSSVTEVAHTVTLYAAVAKVLEQHRPDVIVTTYPSYQAPLLAYLNINRSGVPLITVVTDLVTLHRLWFQADVDLCLVPNEIAADLAVRRGIPRERVKVTGLPVNPALQETAVAPRELRAQLGWRTDLFTVLCVGSKRVEGLEAFAHVLNHSGFPLQLVLVAGGDDALYTKLEQMTWHVPAHIYNFVDNMPTMLHAADCVLSKAGGLIVSESLAAGRPLLLTQAIAGQETGNARYVVEGGAGDMTLEPLQLLETVCHWLVDDRALYRERAAQARQIGRPAAADDVAQIVAAAAQSGRTRRKGIGPDVDSLKALLAQFGVSLE